MKELIRSYIDDNNNAQLKLNGYFIAVGQWANGNLAYSRIDPDTHEVISESDNATYVQVRFNHSLIMVHI